MSKGEPRRFVLDPGYLPPPAAWPRAFEGRRWRARAGVKANMKQDAVALVKADGGLQGVLKDSPFEKAHITITYRSPRGNFDLDNALAASKGWIDGLVAAGAIRNDTALRISYSLYWERADQEDTAIVVQEVM